MSETRNGHTLPANGVASRAARHGLPADTSSWTCVKRDGREVPFDRDKIAAAVSRCFETVGVIPEADRGAVVTAVTRAAVNVINKSHPDGVVKEGVEDVQRVVIGQLWAMELYEEAEHYQNYREARRKARLATAVDPEVAARFAADKAHFPTDLQRYQFMGKFSRWREEDKRRETWRETCDRTLGWLFDLPLVRGKLSDAERAELDSAMYNLESSPAMRVVQMAGPALDRCNMGAYNCSYAPFDDTFALTENLYILMQGTGGAFSVEQDYVDKFPRVKKQRRKKPDTHVVEDDTEAWCSSFHAGLERWFDGHDLHFDVSPVRKKNSRLRTKGGRASGPGPLLELLAFSRNLIMSRQGVYLEDIDLHDLGCMTGKIVQVGGVRRAALLSLSERASQRMREAKSGNWYDGHMYRSQANNSAVYNFKGRPPIDVFLEEWTALVKSKSGERGIFNRHATVANRPERRKKARFGVNACAEINLRPRGLCNLSIAIARAWDTVESLKRKVRAATIFGIIQSTATKFRYVRDEWRKNAEEERLLGVDITGHADCPLLRYGAPGREELIRELGRVVKETKAEFSPRFGINDSAADTCVKPGGDSGIFFDCASGVSPRFSEYQTRWVREPKESPVAKFLVDAGVPYADAPEDPGALYVFGFPKAAPPGATKRNDLSARDQFFNWLQWKTQWAEHSVSATIYAEDHEWLDLGALVYEHFDQITGLSFLPKDNGSYTYAPNEELTEEQYHKAVAEFPDLDWSKLTLYEEDDETTGAQTVACGAGGCDL